MKLSIIIPVYNEKKTILPILEKVSSIFVENKNKKEIKKEIIVIDDGSTDGTQDILKTLKKCLHFTPLYIFYHQENKGKGAALRTGFTHATGDIILIQDADLEYNPNDYQKLINPILDGKEEVVYGCRFFNKKMFNKNMYYSHYLGNILLSWVTSVLYSANVKDMETCYKVFRRKTLNSLSLTATGFDIEPEITAKLLKKKIHIHEEPIDFSPRSFDEGKKINWVDGITALWILVKCRFRK